MKSYKLISSQLISLHNSVSIKNRNVYNKSPSCKRSGNGNRDKKHNIYDKSSYCNHLSDIRARHKRQITQNQCNVSRSQLISFYNSVNINDHFDDESVRDGYNKSMSCKHFCNNKGNKHNVSDPVSIKSHSNLDNEHKVYNVPSSCELIHKT